MNEQLFVALVITGLLLIICGALRPPKEHCNIREVQFQIGMVILFGIAQYKIVSLLW